MGLKRSAKAIRGRGANIFTQWVGDPDALGQRGRCSPRSCASSARRRSASSPAASATRRTATSSSAAASSSTTRTATACGGACTAWWTPRRRSACWPRPGVDPVKDYFFVADHHADPAEVEENCRAKGVRRVRLPFVGLPVGSTSAFMAVIAAAFDVLDKLTPAEKAAAALGIYTDTSALLHGATPLDFKMFEVLTRAEETQEILDELRDYRVPPEWYAYRASAFRNQEVTGAVRVAAGRVRPRRAPRRDRRDRERAAARRGHLDRHHHRGHRARGRGLRARGQPPAGPGPAPHRRRDRLPSRRGLPRPLGLPPRPPAAAPRGGRRLRPPDPGAAHGVAPRQRRRARGRQRSDPGPLPGAGAAAGGGAARPGDSASRPRWRGCSRWWRGRKASCPATGITSRAESTGTGSTPTGNPRTGKRAIGGGRGSRPCHPEELHPSRATRGPQPCRRGASSRRSSRVPR